LIASAGHDIAHVGTLQCMQIIGVVCGLIPGSAWSTWIIGVPRCVLHSEHAAWHAMHPMHRWKSMNMSRIGSVTAAELH
jgi:hypothetical protein